MIDRIKQAIADLQASMAVAEAAIDASLAEAALECALIGAYRAVQVRAMAESHSCRAGAQGALTGAGDAVDDAMDGRAADAAVERTDRLVKRTDFNNGIPSIR